MLVKSKIVELADWLFEEEIPDGYVPDKPLVENRISISKDPVHMEFPAIDFRIVYLAFENAV